MPGRCRLRWRNAGRGRDPGRRAASSRNGAWGPISSLSRRRAMQAARIRSPGSEAGCAPGRPGGTANGPGGTASEPGGTARGSEFHARRHLQPSHPRTGRRHPAPGTPGGPGRQCHRAFEALRLHRHGGPRGAGRPGDPEMHDAGRGRARTPSGRDSCRSVARRQGCGNPCLPHLRRASQGTAAAARAAAGRAERIRSMAESSCAAERNHASNTEGGR